MKNNVFLNKDGIVEIQVVGDQTFASVAAMGTEARVLLDELGQRQKPRLILDDIIKLGKTDIAARREVSRVAHTLPYERVAMLGDGSTIMRVSTNLLLRAIGMGKKVHYFEDRAKAVAWLLGKSK